MDAHGRGEGAGDSLGIGQEPGAFLPAGLMPVQVIPKDQGRGKELSTADTVLSLMAANGSYVSIELPPKPARRESTVVMTGVLGNGSYGELGFFLSQDGS